jgi:DNA-binding beta-propeller fold protein YncE
VARALDPAAHRLYVGGTGLTAFVTAPDGRIYAPTAVPSQDRPVSALAAGPDGSIYAAVGDEIDAIAPGSATTATAPVAGPRDIAVAPDGTGVYAAAANLEQPEGARDILRSSALVSFSASPFGQAGCTVYEGRAKNPGCAAGPGLYEAQTVAITPDGRHAIAGFIDSGALLLLDRDPGTQRLTPVAGRGGCVRAPRGWIEFKVTLRCNRGHGLYAPLSVAISPDGRSAYLASGDGLASFALR